MSPLEQAIQNLQNALDEAEKRAAAKALGSAIGTALGQMSTLWRSDSQIDEMSLEEIGLWCESVASSIGPTP